MRNASQALLAAAAAGNVRPTYKLEIADAQPHFSTIAGVSAPGPSAAAIAPDGAAVFASVAVAGSGYPMNTVVVQRSSAPGTAAGWPGWTTITPTPTWSPASASSP